MEFDTYLWEKKSALYMQKLIVQMYELNSYPVASYSLSAWTEYKESGEFYADPLDTVQFCRTLIPQVVSRDDYMPHDCLYVPETLLQMFVSINQPAYLPWLGYFHRIAISNLHIVLEHVQFEKNSFTNRNKVKTANGWCWLTVPVKTKGKFCYLPIKSLEIDNSTNWRMKHWHTICHSYSKAPYFQEHKLFFESVYQREWQYLSDLCLETTNYLLKALGMNTPLVFSSEMKPDGVKDELVLNLCQKVGTSTYFSGILGQNYIREELFKQAGMKVVYQNYQHPEYPQCWGKVFEPYMSIIDLLFNCGSGSFDILISGQDKIQA